MSEPTRGPPAAAMAPILEGDFEKGEADGTVDALAVICAAASARRHAEQMPHRR